MDDFYNLTDQQRDKVFQLMEIVGNDNIEMAQIVLTMNQWNLEASIESFLNDYSRQPGIKQDNSTEEEDLDWGYQDLEKKKSDFNQMFPDLKLTEQVSDLLSMRRQSSTTKDDQERIKKYAERLAKENPKYRALLENSQKQIQSNKKFIAYLQSKFKSGINFSFGDFSSNLMKAYVKKKPLLVYVHRSTDSASAKQLMGQLLQDQRITAFLNKNFVVYGMFDNSTDYSIIQPSLAISTLPGCAVFVYDEKKKGEVCLGAESLLRKDKQGIMNFATKCLQKAQSEGSAIKKETPGTWKQTEEEARIAEHRIKDEQQQIYDQLEKEYMLKRQQSKLRKVDRQKALTKVEQIKGHFQKEPESGAGVVEINFRQPVSGKPIRRRFHISDKVEHMFSFVEGFCSAEFQNEFGEFDLVQTYPQLSLLSHKQDTIKQVFGDSDGESLIIKQL